MKKLIILLIIIIFLNSFTKAQEKPLFFLTQAIATAVQNNPSLIAQEARPGISEARVLTAKTLINPFISYEDYTTAQLTTYKIERTFTTGRVGKYSKRVAENSHDLDVLDTEIQKLDLEKDVRMAYIEHYNIVETLKAYQEVYDTGEKFIENAKKQEKTGKITHLEILQAESFLLDINNNIQHYKYHVITTKNDLEKLLGKKLPEGAVLEPASEFPSKLKKIIEKDNEITDQDEIKIEKLTQTALQKSPLMLEAHKNVELAENQKKLAIASAFPIVIIAVGAFTDNRNNVAGTYVNVNMELPIFKRNQGGIQEAKSSLDYYKKQEKAVNNQIKYEVNNSYTEVVAAKEIIDRLEKENLPKADEVRKEAINQYKAGKTGISTVLDAEKSYLDTKSAYLHMLQEYQTAISDLERNIGVSL